jgi:hypothetical protein
MPAAPNGPLDVPIAPTPRWSSWRPHNLVRPRTGRAMWLPSAATPRAGRGAAEVPAPSASSTRFAPAPYGRPAGSVRGLLHDDQVARSLVA